MDIVNAALASPQMRGSGLHSQVSEVPQSPQDMSIHLDATHTLGERALLDGTSKLVSMENEITYVEASLRNLPMHASLTINDASLQIAGADLLYSAEDGMCLDAGLPEMSLGCDGTSKLVCLQSS